VAVQGVDLGQYDRLYVKEVAQ
jgi:hypothetical protein